MLSQGPPPTHLVWVGKTGPSKHHVALPCGFLGSVQFWLSELPVVFLGRVAGLWWLCCSGFPGWQAAPVSTV